MPSGSFCLSGGRRAVVIVNLFLFAGVVVAVVDDVGVGVEVFGGMGREEGAE